MRLLLEVKGLHAAYGATKVLHGIDLQMQEGSITALLGANGAGKTTTLLGICARVPRKTGRIVLDGEDVTGLNTVQLVRAGIALCPENRRLFPNMTLQDNLLLGAYGTGRKTEQARLAQAYERFAWIGERRGELAGRLSGGQQQTVAIARSLMSHPRLLLLDEPSSGLSPVAIEEVRQLLEQVTAEGTAVLLVEQNVKLVQSLCESAWVLAHGEVKDSGRVSDLLSGVRVADAYLGGLAVTGEAPLDAAGAKNAAGADDTGGSTKAAVPTDAPAPLT